MNNTLFCVFIGIGSFITGYYSSMTYWYERAEKGSLIEIRGEIYKLEKQTVAEKAE